VGLQNHIFLISCRRKGSPARRCTLCLSVSGVSRHVISLCFKCFSCFRCKFQVFYMDVAYVAVVAHICCIRLFPMSHLFFQRMLQMYLSGCCICFTHMLQVFYLNIAYICNDFQVFLGVFANVSDICCKCFIYF
jgi:hypothetical protein